MLRVPAVDGRRPIIDISAPLRSDLVTWPGVVERFARSTVASFEAGDAMTVSHLHLGAHAGTHVDAPCHFLPDGGGIETIAASALIGPAEVIAVPAGQRVITAALLDEADVPAGTTRLLARTTNSGWSRTASTFDESYVAFDASAATWCVDRGIELVGIDYLSVEPFDADARDYPVHKVLLRAGVVVLESLDLAGVSPGTYDLVVLPLLIPGSDGAPARAILVGPEDAPSRQAAAPTTA
jgi:arylformamidase